MYQLSCFSLFPRKNPGHRVYRAGEAATPLIEGVNANSVSEWVKDGVSTPQAKELADQVNLQIENILSSSNKNLVKLYLEVFDSVPSRGDLTIDRAIPVNENYDKKGILEVLAMNSPILKADFETVPELRLFAYGHVYKAMATLGKDANHLPKGSKITLKNGEMTVTYPDKATVTVDLFPWAFYETVNTKYQEILKLEQETAEVPSPAVSVSEPVAETVQEPAAEAVQEPAPPQMDSQASIPSPVLPASAEVPLEEAAVNPVVPQVGVVAQPESTPAPAAAPIEVLDARKDVPRPSENEHAEMLAAGKKLGIVDMPSSSEVGLGSDEYLKNLLYGQIDTFLRGHPELRLIPSTLKLTDPDENGYRSLYAEFETSDRRPFIVKVDSGRVRLALIEDYVKKANGISPDGLELSVQGVRIYVSYIALSKALRDRLVAIEVEIGRANQKWQNRREITRQAEYARLTGELDLYIGNKRYIEAYRIYLHLLEFERQGVQVHSAVHANGAYAARDIGDTEATLLAWKKAAGAASYEGDTEKSNEYRGLAEGIENAYAKVQISVDRAHQGPIVLKKIPPPNTFSEYEQYTAIVFARGRLAVHGTFSGMLPIGNYLFNGEALEVR